MQTYRIILSLVFSLPVILAANSVTFACWCRPTGPVLDQFENSKLVIVARVVSADVSKAVVGVERAYKGKAKAGDQLTFSQGLSNDCAVSFGTDKVGELYLLYLNKPSKVRGTKQRIYSASLCGGSKRLTFAFDDTAYLDRRSEKKGKTRLSGYFRTAQERNPSSFEGLVIKIAGGRAFYSVKTDSNGFFEIYDLPAGTYVIDPEIPSGWHIDHKYMFGVDRPPLSNRYQISVKARRHTLTKITVVR